MTIATLTFAGVGAPQLPDRGVSEEARKLRGLIKAVLEFPNSIAIGASKRDAFVALRDTFQRAQCSNWDACDAEPVDESTYEYALAFLRVLPSSVPVPEIALDSDGEIAFEWDFGPRQVLSVSVGRDGTLTYAGLFGGTKSHGTEQLAGAIPPHVALNLERIVRASHDPSSV